MTIKNILSVAILVASLVGATSSSVAVKPRLSQFQGNWSGFINFSQPASFYCDWYGNVSGTISGSAASGTISNANRSHDPILTFGAYAGEMDSYSSTTLMKTASGVPRFEFWKQ